MNRAVKFLGDQLTDHGRPVVMGGLMTERPESFTPHGAPPFVELRLSAYKTSTGDDWWRTRQIIRPRLQLVHTNGARGEGSIESAINWGNAASGNTKPHYQVDRWRAAKLVPTDRRAIGNGTVDAYQAGHGDVGEWSIVIETADEGYPIPGEDGGFIGDQFEMIAQILAYESITHGIPLETPVAWFAPGTAAHTDPFGYPYWTIAQGKVCPGRTKKRQLRETVIPRARQIVAEWSTEPDLPPGDDDMTPEIPNRRIMDTQPLPTKVAPGTVVTVDTGVTGRAVLVNIVAIDTDGPGFVVAWGPGGDPGTSNVNYDHAGQTIANLAAVPLDGKLIRFTTGHSAADVIIDLQGVFA